MSRVVSSKLLFLNEVTSLGEPALFLYYGESLLYKNGVLYDLHEAVTDAACAYPPEPLPGQILELGTGIEYGWRHLVGCECTGCREQRAA